jgi:uncharacterized membrane protein
VARSKKSGSARRQSNGSRGNGNSQGTQGRSGSGSSRRSQNGRDGSGAGLKEKARSLAEKVKPGGDSGLFSNTTRGDNGGAVKNKTGRAARNTIDKAKDTVSDGLPKPNKLARKLAAKAAKAALSKTLEKAAGALRTAADRAAETSKEATERAAEKTAHKRAPVQASVDVAVPIRVAWEEWESFEFLPEGTHTVGDIERDGDTLVGQIDGFTSSEWVAEILDERDQESFAWQSHVGSDCAGLITFHELSEKLTRLELDLDVVPTSVGETLSLATHRADRNAERDLRRFKAHLEFMNPDLYEEDEDEEPEDDEPEDEEPQDEEHDADEAEADDEESIEEEAAA